VVSTVDVPHAGDRSAQLHPDVILFDAARQGSVEFVKDLVASAPHSKVVAFGVKETDEEILALAAAGTAGYVRESAESTDVVRVLEQVMCDELTCSPRAAASLYRHVAVLSQGGNDPVGVGNGHADTMPLSRRELQIAHLIDCGLTNSRSAAGWESKLRRSRTTSTTCARNSRYTGAAKRSRGSAPSRARCCCPPRRRMRIRRSKRAEHQKNPAAAGGTAAMSATPGPTPARRRALHLAPRRPRPQVPW